MRVRKKPVEVQAWSVRELVEAATHNPSLLPPAVMVAIDLGTIKMCPDHLHVMTLEGDMLANGDTDWLIQGVEGEFYPCKNDIFQKTYDIV